MWIYPAVPSSMRLVTSPFCTFLHPRCVALRIECHLSTSPFQPAPPPQFNGDPVFDDIDLDASYSIPPEGAKRNSDDGAVFVVSGSSRGIGLQYVKSLLRRSKGHVVACCRSQGKDNELNEFLTKVEKSSRSRISVLTLDVEDQCQIERLGEDIEKMFGRVDALFNVAGILGDGVNTAGPERSISQIDRAWVEKTLAVNVIGPVMLTKTLAPMMISNRRRRPKGPGNEKGNITRAKSVVVNMSARVGSISDNHLGGWYSYRISKAALNQATKTMALELKRQGTWAVSLHPGTTDTDLSKPYQKNVRRDKLFPVEFTVERMLDLVDAMEGKHSGGFYDWAGKALPF